MTQLSVYADYLSRAQEYAISAQDDENARYNLFRLIDEYLASQPENSSYEQMLLGEKAFYHGNYELALKHYLKAHDLPDFHFFCYRASAFVSYKMGKTNKAFFFAKKALKLHPEDAYTQNIYNQLKTVENEEYEAAEPTDPIKELYQESATTRENSYTKETSETLTVSQELEELSHIFKDRSSLESLFQDEKNEPYSSNYQESPWNNFSKTSSDTDSSAEQGIEERIQNFQRLQKDWVADYREKAKKNRAKHDDLLLVLNGWEHHLESESSLPHLLQLQQLKKTTGGLYIRWSGKGIAINPGTDFLERLHKEGLFVNDIDAIIVTRDTPEAYADLQSIYNLNYQLNREQTDLHIINYYLNQRAYQNVARILKPNFKQERNTIHCLDLFLDSPDVEKIQINEEVTLNYFPTTWSKNKETGDKSEYNAASTYGITLELKQTNRRNLSTNSTLKIGYISGTPWSPMLAAGLGKCDLLITGIDNTGNADWSRRAYNSDSLGYYGAYTLLEEVAPRILVCTEFSGSEGDIRLEFTKKMRRDYAQNIPRTGLSSPIILPGDTGLYINLTNLKVRCSFSNTFIDPQGLHIVKLRDFFGKLQYLSSNCLI